MKSLLLLSTLFWAFAHPVCAQIMPNRLSLKEQAQVMDEVLEHRLLTLIPEIMRKHRVDMWIVVSREYNEDPVIKTMLPATWFAARRRTILVFHDEGKDKGVQRYAIARYDVGRFFKSAWNPEQEPDQLKRLGEFIKSKNPGNIALNYSSTFGLADGISKTDFDLILAHLPKNWDKKVLSAEPLSIAWLETRTAKEMHFYPIINRIAHTIIEEGFSEKVIMPGITSTEDVQWWYRERIQELGLVTWFQPTVSLQRANDDEHAGDFSSRPGAQIILPGDLLHVDFGITYLRLNTDTQRHAYILKVGESDAPKGLKEALAVGNRLQDILTSQFKSGRTGNEILSLTRAQAIKEGIQPSIYTHPIGYHGHAAGPAIGLWDQQDGVKGQGDYPLYPNTAHSIELNATVFVPEWKKNIRIMLEEDAFFDGETVRYIDGRQTTLYLIPRPR